DAASAVVRMKLSPGAGWTRTSRSAGPQAASPNAAAANAHVRPRRAVRVVDWSILPPWVCLIGFVHDSPGAVRRTVEARTGCNFGAYTCAWAALKILPGAGRLAARRPRTRASPVRKIRRWGRTDG